MLPVLELADAKVIVSLDADLFGDGSPLAIKYARDFAAGRRLHDKNKQKEMNRLYVIESLHTITGASADHRLACRAGEIGAIARNWPPPWAWRASRPRKNRSCRSWHRS